MWVPVDQYFANEANDADIEILVPSETDETAYHPAQDLDQALYSHYTDTDDVITPSARPLSGYRATRARRNRKSGIVDDPQDDLGFVDQCDSDLEDGGLLLPGPRIRRPRTASHGTRRGTNTNPRKQQGLRGLSAESPEPTGGQARRVFHRPSMFIPARYPAKFHKGPDQKGTNNKKAKNAALKLPPSLSVRSRYGREAVLVGDRGKRSTLKQWPTPPIYPPKPKVRDFAVECHIMRFVETVDTGTQNVPLMKTKQMQFGLPRKEMATQYPRTRKKDIGLDPKELLTKSQCIQIVPDTRNAMVETSVSVMYHKGLVITEDQGCQTIVGDDDNQGAEKGQFTELPPLKTDTGCGNEEKQWNELYLKEEPESIPESPLKLRPIENNLTPLKPPRGPTILQKEDSVSNSKFDIEDEAASEDSMEERFNSLALGDLSDRSLPTGDPHIETSRELIGLPDSGSEEEGEEDNERERSEGWGRRGSVLGTSGPDPGLPPLSVCGRSPSMSSVQVPVEDN